MMKRNYKYLFIITFIISSFLFINNVKADYEAAAVNPSGAKCNLYSKTSTGYCYYTNSSLNSYVNNVVWLDNGDKVTVFADIPTVDSPNKSLCSDYYVYTSYYSPIYKNTYKGYYCHANLSAGEITNALKTEFTSAGFPESYWKSLAILRQAHPNWKFKAINTKLNFNDVVSNEAIASWSLVQKSASNSYAYLATDSTSFDYKNNKFIEYDGIGSDNPWLNASYSTVAYYMDPRNFLIDMYMFQFEGLSYDNSISDTNLTNTINTAFKGDYLLKFTNDFISAGKQSKVNPIYLSALAKQEVGGFSTASTAINGKYNGMYNFYNIGATGGTNPVINGLNYAAKSDASTLRPWKNEYNAIVGGALWIGKNYINVGQDTIYFKKWNVVHDYLTNPVYSNYKHQYQTNVMAPSSEARITYKSYYENKLLDLDFVFYIPIYNNMPNSTALSTKTGWPNNYLSNLKINNNLVADFKGEVENYNYYLDVNNASVTIAANPISSTAKVSGLGTYNITTNTAKKITVTAENGNIKTYNINIVLTGTKLEDPTDVVKTLNNAGIKNGNNYLSGFILDSDISSIRTKINNANKDAIITLKNSSGAIKNSGILSTGDKVNVTVGTDTKSYDTVIYGDVNGDGKIDALDYVRIRKYIMNTFNLNGAYKTASDVNKDGKVDALDYVKIRKYIMNTSTIVQ